MKNRRSLRERFRPDFRFRLIGLVVLTALFAGGLIGGALITSSYQVLREEVLASNLAAADLAALFAANYIDGAETNLRQLAARPLLIRAVFNHDLPEAEFHLAQFMQIDKRFDNVAVYSASGIGWASGIGSQWQNRGKSVADREWFRQTITAKKPYLGVPVLSRGTGHPVVSFTIPLINKKGDIYALVVGGISLAALSDAITNIYIKPGTQASLMDARQGGIILAHTDKRLILTPIPKRNEAVLLAVSGKRGILQTSGAKQNDSQLAAFAPAPGLPWSILILEPTKTAFAPLKTLTTQMTLFLPAIILVAIILGIWLAGTVSGPVRRLSEGAAAIGGGNLEYRIPVTTHDELGVLAGEFNRMAANLGESGRENRHLIEQLKNWSEELESRVAERTKELKASQVATLNMMDDLAGEVRERRQAEEELKRSNAELEQFAYVASHDLQEPLRMISSYMQLLERRYKGQLDQDADDFIGFATDGAARMQRLINDLLAFSRIGTRGQPLKNISSETILAQALENLQLSVTENKAKISHDPLPEVMADETQLTQVFQNLIGNALKFRGKKAPCIHISAEAQGAEWQFSVRDNGIGIDPQYAERVFVIFQRLHDRGEYSGTGIGLAICKKIIQRHGGRIWIESAPGNGTTFYFTLPKTGGG